MNPIAKHSKIDQKKLSHEFYFQSLLQEAYLQGELNATKSERIQNECLALLTKTIDRYTKGQSSSVRIEIAQSIMASNVYTISLYLKSLPSVSAALDQIINEPIEKLFAYGYDVLKRKFKVANYFFHLVGKTKISTPNHAYNVTIDHGLSPFFTQYDFDFCAHEAPSSIDYQLIHPVTDLAGVEFMIQYLENLYYENLFCQKFDSNIIDEVMSGYHRDYPELLDNLCAQVFQNALGCLLVQKPVRALDLSPADLEKIREELQAKSRPWITARLTDAALRLFSELGLTKASIRHYFISILPEITAKIIAGLQTDTLSKIFVSRYSPDTKFTIRYDMGTRMADESYRQLLDEFLSCRYLDDKLALIKASVHALADLEDLLLAGELKSDESAQVFDLLADTELAVLFKRHPLNPEIAAIDFSASEIGLQERLNQYRQALPPQRMAAIAKIMTKLEIA
jgi:hypothetical protein